MSSSSEPPEKSLAIAHERGSVSGLWTAADSARAAAVVAHGAGAGIAHPFMAGVAMGLARGDVSCLRFNFPYIEEGRRSPDSSPRLMECWRLALNVGVTSASGVPIGAGGKSLGGRMASMLAAEAGPAFPAAALVFFGYPLHPPGRPEQRRDAHLFDVTVPMLFLQGTADPFARFDLLEALVRRLGPRARLHPVEGGDHSFRVRGTKRSDREIGEELGGEAARFILEVSA